MDGASMPKMDAMMGPPDAMMGPPDAMMGPPPAAVPEKEAKKDGMLPPAQMSEQPIADVPPSFLLPSMSSPKPEAKVNQGIMSKMSNMLGGHDVRDPESGMAPAAPVYGGNWRQCSCGDGTQVMILK